MNVVIFSNGSRGPKQFRLTSFGFVAAACAVLAITALVVFAGGYSLALHHSGAVDHEQMQNLRAELLDQHQELQDAKRDAQDTLDALAIRVGQMNAHVVRLNALGQRLTEMAGLEGGEFDFESAPPIGGPEDTEILKDLDEASLATQLVSLDVQMVDRAKQLGVLESMLLTRSLGEQIMPRGRPVVDGWISSHYGTRTDPFTGKQARHKGVDIAARAGAEIRAVASGVVTYSGNRYGYGTMVELDHGDGYVTRYAHNAENHVSVGDEVSKGQVIGLMGSTGRATGPNLHFEVLKGGKNQNPVPYIRGNTP